MWAILLAALSAAPERQIERCAVDAVSFRTSNEAWLFDACGQVFRSFDGGEGWGRERSQEKAILGAESDRWRSSRRVRRLTWLTPQIGLAFPSDRPVMRTEDGGATWMAVGMGVQGFVHAVQVIGTRVWFSDESGQLKTSPDLGLNWQINRTLFHDGGVKPRDWCAALSFVDEARGWALGWRSLWQTIDGGATWTRLSLPRADVPFRALMRANVSIASLSDKLGHRFVTSDGAKTWKSVTANTEWDPKLWAPEDELDSRFAFNVELMKKLEALRTGPLLLPANRQRVPLTQVAGERGSRWGAVGGEIYRVGEDVEVLVAELSAPVTRLAALETGSWLAETADGLFKDGKRANAADQMDFERLTRPDGQSFAQRSLECLQTQDGWLRLEWGWRGCFGASRRSSLHVTLERARARRSLEGEGKHHSSGMTLAAARGLLKRVSIAATRPESMAGCRITTETEATLTWQCRGQAQQELKFSSSACGSDGYERASGLAEIGEGLLVSSDAGVK